MARMIGLKYKKYAIATCQSEILIEDERSSAWMPCGWTAQGEPGPIKTRGRAHAQSTGHAVEVQTIDRILYEGMK